LKIIFLGTGTSQGVPMIMCSCATCLSKDPKDKRLRTSLHIQEGDVSLVIDIGPDFRQQMLSHQIPEITGILLTHNHVDHTAGIEFKMALFHSMEKNMYWMILKIVSIIYFQNIGIRVCLKLI
jgi:phosphoribosyl 1,2-cyclic phosphate phosphodiesterase